MEEAVLQAERASIADGATQDAAEDVVAVGVAGLDAVGDGERKRADVVGDDAEGHVVLLLLRVADRAGGGQGGAVFLAGEFLEAAEERGEDVALVIGDHAGEVLEVLRALHDAGDAFEAHARVDVAGRERAEGAVGVGVELDEDQVPDLHAAGVAAVDERALGVAFRGQVDVEFGARTAGAGLAHHPEVVLLVAVDDVDGRVEAGGAELLGPDVPGFLVELGGVALGLVRLVDGGVEAVLRELPDLGDELPGVVDGLALEVVAEGPVTQHLEERVVVGVEADVFEVVVLTAGADALLGVGGAAGGVRALRLAEEDRDELVHPGVGEEQVGGVRHQARRLDDRVLLRFEEIEEGLADLGGGHGTVKRREEGVFLSPWKGKREGWNSGGTWAWGHGDKGVSASIEYGVSSMGEIQFELPRWSVGQFTRKVLGKVSIAY